MKTIILEAKMEKIKCHVFPLAEEAKVPCQVYGSKLCLRQEVGLLEVWNRMSLVGLRAWRKGRKKRGQKECIFPLGEQRKENLHSFIIEGEMHANET